ncbi:MAG: DUF3040 domain-containing protein [Propionibacteriaceae bacterium]|nr:DUF3040 domain-containing protein [Propionibacteriaceae bacterium]
MALTDEEQRLLDVLEASLADENSKGVKGEKISGRAGLPATSRLVIAGLGLVVGVLLLIAGVKFFWWLSVLGFLAMFGGVAFALINTGALSADAVNKRAKHPRRVVFMERMEDRWSSRK